MSSAMEEEQHLQECESYIQTHRILQLMKDCIVQLCVARPENPIPFLRQYFQKLERVSLILLLLLLLPHRLQEFACRRVVAA